MLKVTIEARTLREMKEASEDGSGVIAGIHYTRALEWVEERQADWFDGDSAISTWKEALADIGIRADIAYSGFGVQGSGASFAGQVDDMARFIAFLRNPPAARDSIDFVDGREIFAPWIVHETGADGAYLRMDDSEVQTILNEGIGAAFERTSMRSSHEASVSVRMLGDEASDVADDLVARVSAAIEAFRIDACRAIYRFVEADYAYCRSEEACLEAAEASDWHFDEYGHRVDGARHRVAKGGA